jgi:hypothetical protein
LKSRIDTVVVLGSSVPVNDGDAAKSTANLSVPSIALSPRTSTLKLCGNIQLACVNVSVPFAAVKSLPDVAVMPRVA